MSATLAPATLRIARTEAGHVSPAVETVRAMPIEQIRAEIKRRRTRTGEVRESEQRASIAADAQAASDRIRESAA